jgi:hypothetical protein
MDSSCNLRLKTTNEIKENELLKHYIIYDFDDYDSSEHEFEATSEDVITSELKQTERNKDYQLLLQFHKDEIEWLNIESSKVYFKIKNGLTYTLISDVICLNLFNFIPDVIEIDLQLFELKF